jgi:serine/threonine-protein kinase RsbW
MTGAFERKFTLHVPSSTENLALIREFVSSVATQAGLDEKDIAKLELAVDEACTNVIEHAYGHDSTKEVTVRAIVDDENLNIHVVDTGRGFDPAAVPQPDLQSLISERRTGGLGLRVIKSLMDEVHYEIIPGIKNELHMTKRIRKKSPDDGPSA